MRDWAEASFTILLMGCVPVIIRHTDANPWTIGIVRLVVALAGLVALMQATRRWRRLSWREWRALALIGVLFAAACLADTTAPDTRLATYLNSLTGTTQQGLDDSWNNNGVLVIESDSMYPATVRAITVEVQGAD